MKEIDIIQQFEKDFIEAGKLAQRLRKDATISDKSTSGIKDIDVVTSSDLAVQEFLLQKLAKSELKNCELVGEEKTPSKSLFAEHSDIVLTLDPIDGTMAYATGGKYYSVIVTLHDKKRPIYTFDYFPELDWGVKIVNDKVELLGQRPDISEMTVPAKVISYATFDSKQHPKESIPELYKEYTDKGYVFMTKSEMGYGVGATASFLLGIADGFYYLDGSAVDCLVGMHFALANDYKMYRTMDISEARPSDFAGGSSEYKGYYLVLRNEK